MILPPVKNEYRKIFEKMVSGNDISDDLEYLLGNNDLKTKIEFFEEIVNSNLNIEQGEIEEVVLMFVNKIISISRSIYSNIDDHKDTTVSIWRTMYEATVLFRVWSQTLNRNKSLETFKEIGTRFKDYGLIDEYKTMGYNQSPEIRELMNKYYKMPKERQLNYEYDWLNPIFTDRELKQMKNSFHPTFRDLVHRTQETDHYLFSLLTSYKLSSSVIHISYVSNTILDTLTQEDIYSMTNEVIRSFIVDYLELIENLYQDVNNPTVSAIQIYSKKLKLKISGSWY